MTQPVPLRKEVQHPQPNALEEYREQYVSINERTREMDRLIAQRWPKLTTMQAFFMREVLNGADQPHLAAKGLKQQSQTVTGILDRLERSGYLKRKRDRGDRRTVRLEPTPTFYDVIGSTEKFLKELLGIAELARNNAKSS